MKGCNLTKSSLSPEVAAEQSASLAYLQPFALAARIFFRPGAAATIGAAVLGAVAIITSYFIAIPRAEILPADGSFLVRNDDHIQVKVPLFSSISRVSVTADKKQQWLEYNIEENKYTVPVQLTPGSTYTVEVKVTSSLGIIREFSSTFTTAEPLKLTSATAAGQPLEPEVAVSPASSLNFIFDKPVEAAKVTLDGSASIPLIISDDGRSATLKSIFVLKQGTQHEVSVWAIGKDGSALTEGNTYKFKVIPPLSLKLQEASISPAGSSVATIIATAPFDDPQLVLKSIQVSHPDLCRVSVEGSHILLYFQDPGMRDISVAVASAFGKDGSYLEVPAIFSFTPATYVRSTTPTSFNFDGSRPGCSNAAPISDTNNLFAVDGSHTANSHANPAPVPQSDVPSPPPGWPACCPWPPRQ